MALWQRSAKGGFPSLTDLPLIRDRNMINGKPTAYVCQNYACQLPVTDEAALAAQLEG